MCDVPFFPIFPICFQCGTDQNPCHCKVVGPTLGASILATILITIHLTTSYSVGFLSTVVAAVSEADITLAAV
ncbi:hypothetical protein N7510_011318 [Penicillium lagena]|uniref:uncharacterized protein n=1 Tax=Penicillium lagena TaxID=94218 RepID=UPI002541D867|nr:uncharacterized protein N7510_011318 [Penicillium lagena]KAJ5601784.1 hypothetical protein N7510_011318 [Penicillium lagena]